MTVYYECYAECPDCGAEFERSTCETFRIINEEGTLMHDDDEISDDEVEDNLYNFPSNTSE